MVIKPISKAPSIPSIHYLLNCVDKKVSSNSYTGIGHDNPGPAGYNCKIEAIKRKQIGADFTASK